MVGIGMGGEDASAFEALPFNPCCSINCVVIRNAHFFLFYFQDNLLEKLDDVELEAPSTQDEEVRISRLLEGE